MTKSMVHEEIDVLRHILATDAISVDKQDRWLDNSGVERLASVFVW